MFDIIEFDNEDQISEEVLLKIDKAREEFTEIIEKLITSNFNDSKVVSSYSKYFTILMKLDVIRNSESTQNTDLKDIEELPRWIKLNLTFISNEYEKISFQSLKFLYSLFKHEKNYFTLNTYINFIFNSKKNYQKDCVCWMIFEKLIDLL